MPLSYPYCLLLFKLVSVPYCVISVYESFKEYIAVETLDGDNKYDAGEYGLQVSHTSNLFHAIKVMLNMKKGKMINVDFGAVT